MSECAHEGHSSAPTLKTATQATIHCLTGCVIGEVAGLLIAVTIGLSIWPTVILATTLAYISGFTLGLVPIMRHQGKSFMEALKIIWIGEVFSIGVMEIAMNYADYSVGGMSAMSAFEPVFWLGIAVAVPAGFLAALPVNYWLLSRNLKNCH